MESCSVNSENKANIELMLFSAKTTGCLRLPDFAIPVTAIIIFISERVNAHAEQPASFRIVAYRHLDYRHDHDTADNGKTCAHRQKNHPLSFHAVFADTAFVRIDDRGAENI